MPTTSALLKALADKLGHKYYDYWTAQGNSDIQNIMRMLKLISSQISTDCYVGGY